MVVLSVIYQIHRKKYKQWKKITDGIIYGFSISNMLYSPMEIPTEWNEAGNYFLRAFAFIKSVATQFLTHVLINFSKNNKNNNKGLRVTIT
jgi:uncharacterized membrane protein